MHRFISIFLFVAVIGLTGCGGKSSTIDSSKFEAGLQNGENALKAAAPQIVAAMNKKDFVGAFTAIKTAIVQEPVPSSEQIDAVYEIISQVQKIISEDSGTSVDRLNLIIRQTSNIIEGRPENAGADHNALEKMGEAIPQ